MEFHITTPFGRRSLTAAQVQAQAKADSCPREIVVHKWTVFRHIALGREQLGLSDRSLAVLNALLTFHPETALTRGEGADLVVFPSNDQLSLRAHGVAETTLRRHLAALVEAGIIIRRDSPNGKRYARRRQGNEIGQVYGFDLTPIVARAGEFAVIAEEIAAQRKALQVARERVTLLRRDTAKILDALDDTPNFKALADRYRHAVGLLTRKPSLSDLDAVAETLTRLAAEASKLLIALHEPEESDGSDGHSERHKHNSKPDVSESRTAIETEEEGQGSARTPKETGQPVTYPLGMVLDACPAVIDYARGGIRTWRDLVDVADLVRSMLGISPSVWSEAREVMGQEMAAATVAAILQRAEHIRSPGGYLRTLVDRKKGGQYSLGPVLQALNRAQLGHRA